MDKLTDSKDLEFEPSVVILMEIHRFEGLSNPADSSILYTVNPRTGKKRDCYRSLCSLRIRNYIKLYE